MRTDKYFKYLNLVLFFAFFLFGFVACGQKNATTINGNVKGDAVYTKVTLNKDVNGTLKVVDSSLINSKGDFKFKLSMEEPDIYFLKFEPNLDQYAYLVLSPKQTIDIQFKIEKTIRYEMVKGSEEMKFSKGILDHLDSVNAKLVSLQEAYPNAENKSEIEAEFNQTFSASRAYVKQKLLQNKTMLSCAILLTALDFNEEIAVYEEVLNALNQKYPNNEEVKKQLKKVKSVSGLRQGAEAPEIALPNPQGKVMKLSSLRGKYVLIDFWASWCRPCRAENPNVVALYNKYHPKGFDIFSVSLDNNKSNWENGIQSDGLIWENHVSDLKQWQSEVVPLYGISGIPFTVLIDKNGKVIATGLRGDSLRVKLEELLGKVD